MFPPLPLFMIPVGYHTPLDDGSYDIGSHSGIFHASEDSLLKKFRWREQRSGPSSLASLSTLPTSTLDPLPPVLPGWLWILAAVLNVFNALSCPTIVGLAFHSLSEYSTTRNVYLNGTDISWPKDVNLQPIHFILAIAIVTLLTSFVALIEMVRCLRSHSLSFIDTIISAVSVILFALWVAGDVLQSQSSKADGPDILQWACRMRSSPENMIISYDHVCDEQVNTSTTCRIHQI